VGREAGKRREKAVRKGDGPGVIGERKTSSQRWLGKEEEGKFFLHFRKGKSKEV